MLLAFSLFRFLRELETVEDSAILKDLKEPAVMVMSVEDEQQFRDATTCWICLKALGNDPNAPSVRDHDHVTGHFRGAAHQA